MMPLKPSYTSNWLGTGPEPLKLRLIFMEPEAGLLLASLLGSQDRRLKGATKPIAPDIANLTTGVAVSAGP